MFHFCKKPRSITNTKRHSFITVLAAIGDKRSRLDLIGVNRNLPIGASNVHNDELSSSGHINIIFEVCHRPSFTNEMLVMGAPVTDAKLKLAIYTSNNGHRRGSLTRALFNDIISKHVLYALVGNSFGSWISAIRTPAHGFRIDKERERSFGSSTLAKLCSRER